MRILTWPFRFVWGLLGFVLGLVGRLVLAILALVFLLVGVIATCTYVGAIVGIPLIILGVLFLIRAIF